MTGLTGLTKTDILAVNAEMLRIVEEGIAKQAGYTVLRWIRNDLQVDEMLTILGTLKMYYERQNDAVKRSRRINHKK